MKNRSSKKLVTDADLYGGFTPEQAERYDREAKEKHGDMVEVSHYEHFAPGLAVFMSAAMKVYAERVLSQR